MIVEEANGTWVAPTGSNFSNGSGKKTVGSGGSFLQTGGPMIRGAVSNHTSPSKFQGSGMATVFGGISSGVQDSAMIEKERQALERIKLKQQKEIEQMLEHERQM